MSNDYCTRADIENIFGVVNVAAWADMTGNQNAAEIAARVAWAISAASDELDDLMRGTSYRVPLKTAAGAVPGTVKILVATLAGVSLYENHGVDEIREGQPIHKLLWARERYEKIVQQIKSGQMRLDAV